MELRSAGSPLVFTRLKEFGFSEKEASQEPKLLSCESFLLLGTSSDTATPRAVVVPAADVLRTARTSSELSSSPRSQIDGLRIIPPLARARGFGRGVLRCISIPFPKVVFPLTVVAATLSVDSAPFSSFTRDAHISRLSSTNVTAHA